MRLKYSDVKILQRNDVKVKVTISNRAIEGTLNPNYYDLTANKVMVVIDDTFYYVRDGLTVNDACVCLICPVTEIEIKEIIGTPECVPKDLEWLCERYASKVTKNAETSNAECSEGRGLTALQD